MNNQDSRLHALDAVRGFALLLGVAFHASLSFMPGWPPGIWSMVDNSPSQFLSDAGFVSAHLPHVAVLLHRGVFRPDALSQARRARLLVESRQAHRWCR